MAKGSISVEALPDDSSRLGDEDESKRNWRYGKCWTLLCLSMGFNAMQDCYRYHP